MISIHTKFYCKNFTQIENYEEAVKDNTQIWHCHHRKEIEENMSVEQLKQEGLYYFRPPEELIFLTESEHHRLHSTGNTNSLGKHHTEERKKQISDFFKGNTYRLGIKHTDEAKQKISNSLIGNKYRLGKSDSEETRKKKSESAKKRWQYIKRN